MVPTKLATKFVIGFEWESSLSVVMAIKRALRFNTNYLIKA
jgi:hypothetical protein